MDDFQDFLDDWIRCLELDPFQHAFTVLCFVASVAAGVGLVWVFWALVRGIL